MKTLHCEDQSVIYRVEAGDGESIVEVLRNTAGIVCGRGPFGETSGESLSKEIAVVLDGENGENAVWMATNGGRPAAMLALELLPWDTDHFGIPCGRFTPLFYGKDQPSSPILISQLLELATKEASRLGLRFVSTRVDCDHFPAIQPLLYQKHKCMDTLTYFLTKCDSERIRAYDHPSGIQMRPAVESDLKTLKDIAAESFVFSRFFTDGGFDREKCRDMYRKWIQKSFEHDRYLLLTADDNGRQVGFSILYMDETPAPNRIQRLGHNLFGAVSPEIFGSGKVADLWKQFILIFSEYVEYAENIYHLNNPKMFKFMSLFGGRLFAMKHTFHKWL